MQGTCNPGQGTKIPYATGQLSLHTEVEKPKLQSPLATTAVAAHCNQRGWHAAKKELTCHSEDLVQPKKFFKKAKSKTKGQFKNLCKS